MLTKSLSYQHAKTDYGLVESCNNSNQEDNDVNCSLMKVSQANSITHPAKIMKWGGSLILTHKQSSQQWRGTCDLFLSKQSLALAFWAKISPNPKLLKT